MRGRWEISQYPTILEKHPTTNKPNYWMDSKTGRKTPIKKINENENKGNNNVDRFSADKQTVTSSRAISKSDEKRNPPALGTKSSV